MKQLSLFLFAFVLITLFFSCKNEAVELTDQVEALSANTTPADPRCPPGGCTTSLKCNIPCPTGGYNIKVVEGSAGAIKFTFEPRAYIYVDHAFHTANYPFSSTAYTYDAFILVNTQTGPSVPWKDMSGNVIMGPVYSYKLKNPQCLSHFTTNWLYGPLGGDPCDILTGLLYLNQVQRPNGCGNPDIICPPGDLTHLPGIPSVQFLEEDTTFTQINPTTIYGYDCEREYAGLCFPDTSSAGPDDPQAGPVTYEHLVGEDGSSLAVKFWRDVETDVIEIDESNEELSQFVKDGFMLSEEARLRHGSYPVLEDAYEFGHVIIELEE